MLLSCRGRSSRPALIDEILDAHRVQTDPAATKVNTSRRGFGLFVVDWQPCGDQFGDRASTSRDHDLFAALDLVEQAAQSIFGFKSPDFPHPLNLPARLQSSLLRHARQ